VTGTSDDNGQPVGLTNDQGNPSLPPSWMHRILDDAGL
jgi:hypothetical protein